MTKLYLIFIDLKNMGHQHLPGTMEISETGLKVNYIRELQKGVQINTTTSVASPNA